MHDAVTVSGQEVVAAVTHGGVCQIIVQGGLTFGFDPAEARKLAAAIATMADDAEGTRS